MRSMRSPLSLFAMLLWASVISQDSDSSFASDYYRTLGLLRDATETDIKRAYRRLSLQAHPDKNTAVPQAEAEALFNTINRAYEILSDPIKRGIYDSHGEEAVRQHESHTRAEADPFASIFEAFGYGGGRRRKSEERRSRDVNVPLRVSLEQLYAGDTFEISYVRQVACLRFRDCQIPCGECQAPGVRLRMQQLAPGFVQQIQVQDDRCIADGQCWRAACAACPGGPTQREAVMLNVEVQRGMRSRDTLLFESVADERIGATPGDLVLTLAQTTHPRFRRVNDDLFLVVNLTLAEALLGFERSITLLDGSERTVKRTEVSACGEVVRLKGAGMPRYGPEVEPGTFGDIVAELKIDFPIELTDEQRIAVAQHFGGKDAW